MLPRSNRTGYKQLSPGVDRLRSQNRPDAVPGRTASQGDFAHPKASGRDESTVSETLRHVQALVLSGDYLISEHGFDELDKDAILPGEIIDGIAEAEAIEDYRDRKRGPGVLALQHDVSGNPIHVVWAIPAGQRRPAVLVTAYRPDANRWDSDFKRRTIP